MVGAGAAPEICAWNCKQSYKFPSVSSNETRTPFWYSWKLCIVFGLKFCRGKTSKSPAVNDTGSEYWYGVVLRNSYTPFAGATAVIVKLLQVEPHPIFSMVSQQQLEDILANFYGGEIARIYRKFECEIKCCQHDAVSPKCIEWRTGFSRVYFRLNIR